MKRLLFAMLLALPTLTAQIVTADNCVHQAGDNPAWARPDFDDSEWSKQFPAIGSPYVWTRCRLDMKSLPRTGPIHVGVETLAAWEVFLNGEPAGSSGNIRTGFASMETKQHRPIPPAVANQESISVALRQLPGRAKPNPRPATISAGNKDTLT